MCARLAVNARVATVELHGASSSRAHRHIEETCASAHCTESVRSDDARIVCPVLPRAWADSRVQSVPITSTELRRLIAFWRGGMARGVARVGRPCRAIS